MERVKMINALMKKVMVVKMPAVREEDATDTEIEIQNGAIGKYKLFLKYFHCFLFSFVFVVVYANVRVSVNILAPFTSTLVNNC
jgi:hypothetical protein